MDEYKYEDIINEINTFKTTIENRKYVTDKIVLNLFSKICKCFNLKQIYVVESAGAKNNFIYPYVSKRGPKAKCMHYNLIVMPESETKHLKRIFKNNYTFFDGNMSASSNATAKGNLGYSIEEYNRVIAFVSFQAKKDKAWTDQEKEVIKLLSNALKPLILRHLLKDKFSNEDSLKTSTRVGVMWWYPNLKLMITPEDTMNKFNIQNFIFRNAPNSFVDYFSSNSDKDHMLDFFNNFNNKTTSMIFKSKAIDERFYRFTLSVNRYKNRRKAEEIAIYIEELNNDKTDKVLKYDAFKEIISKNNIAEYYVNLNTLQMTIFKINNTIESLCDSNQLFDNYMNKISSYIESSDDRNYFLRMTNTDYIKSVLSKDNPSIIFANNFLINGKNYCFETTIILDSQSIYNYVNDIFVYVRDITNIESLTFDKSTGVYSFSYFMDKVANYTNLDEYGFAYFDFKDFRLLNIRRSVKFANDTIKFFANLLKETFNKGVISRISNDSFVVFDRKETLENQINIVLYKTKKLNNDYLLDLKVGIYYPRKNDNITYAIDNAKIACSDAKKSNINNLVIYDNKLRNSIEKEKYIVDMIDNAIENKWIKVYYQPVINAKDLSISSFEALSRWVDPKYGFLSPADFISVLEEHNLIYKLDLFVLEEVCKHLRGQMDNNEKVYPISFNLSRLDFTATHPFLETKRIIEKYNISPKLLKVEITESVTMQDEDEIKDAIKKYQNLGFDVWMDDFGSGYSSLNVLKDFSFNEIKIDMGFLKDFSPKSEVIIKSIVNMAKDLKIETLCEGVETKEHVDFLREIGCEKLQGYYFSKPMEYDDVLKTLEEKNIKN